MTSINDALQKPELLEELASIEHERWAHWELYLHKKCEPLPDGSLRIPADLVDQWTRQATTRYEDLTEDEKDSDREQVQRYLPTLMKALGQSDPGSHGARRSEGT